MALPEYYLTRAEHEILREQTKDIVDAFNVDPSTPFELIELGAGDGTKTKEVLNYLVDNNFNFSYKPIDISQNALNQLEDALKEEIPSLKVETLQGDYFGVLSKLKDDNLPKVVFFLGSNMGNMNDDRAKLFMASLSGTLNAGDKVLIGLDLIKSESVVLPAYNDSSGVTAAFNMNLLTRINKELGGNFEVEAFEHAPSYSEATGVARSAIKSLKNQSVEIKSDGQIVHFEKDELIHTEISRKYNRFILDDVLKNSGLKIESKFIDRQGLFSDWVLGK